MVRMCLVRYSLIQILAKEDRASYKGITIKYIRVAIQCLVVILPVEEQENIREIEEQEVWTAFEEVKETEHSKDVLKMEIKYKETFATTMLKQKSEFEELAESARTCCAGCVKFARTFHIL